MAKLGAIKKPNRAENLALAVAAKTIAALQKSGVPILDAFVIAEQTAASRKIRDGLQKARTNIREGSGIAAPLKATGAFPPMFIQMVAAGEETGKLDDMLDKLGNYYMEQTQGRKVDELTAFAAQLGTMQEAGLPLVQSLAIIGENTGGKLGAALGIVGNDIKGGTSFHDALARHPRVFSQLFVNMVKAGEMGGALDVILGRFAELQEFLAKAK